MSTIRQVAKDAGVSIATVSRVLNQSSAVGEGVRARVLEAINRCGYVANVGRRVTSYLGLAYTARSSFGEPYDAALCEGMAEAMDENDCDLVVLNLQRDKRAAETYTQFFLRKGVRGVILRTTRRSRGVCEAVVNEAFPAVVVADHFEDPAISYVYCDSLQASCQGVEHLIALGHERIALAISDTPDCDHTDRLEGCRQAMAGHGIELDPRLVFRIPPKQPQGAQLMRNVMSVVHPPTAIYIADPMVAVGAINEAHEMGVGLPEDLSILGFDDTDVRNNVYPRMTAVCQDAKHLGYEAFMALANMVAAGEKAQPWRETVSAWLEINGTTGRPPASPVRVLPDGTRVVSEPDGRAFPDRWASGEVEQAS